MPLFGKTKSKSKADMPSEVIPRGQRNSSYTSPPQQPLPVSAPQSQTTAPPASKQAPKLVFHCQLAHGSPTGVISGFGNVRELYQKIAGCYDIDDSEVRLGNVHAPEKLLLNHKM